jgi:release factor glutamine methyltransferase
VSADLRARLQEARLRFERAGIPPEEASLDARVLAGQVLGWDAARLISRETEPPPPVFDARFQALVERRAAREPVAYIVGAKEFWNLTFAVGPGVLVPRPETELLVEAALQAFPDRHRRFYAADAGTGCGCIAIAIATSRERSIFLATDISSEALAYARANAERHGVHSQIEFLKTDLLADAPDPFDLIVSNPPYVPSRTAPLLQPEVRDYEPAVALFSGADGLDAIRRLVSESVLRLNPGGWLMFEFGIDQAEAVEELIAATPGLRLSEIRPDLQGIPRLAIARRE